MEGVQLLRFIASLFFVAILIFQIPSIRQVGQVGKDNDSGILQSSWAQTANANTTGPCSGDQYLKEFPDICAPLSECQKVDSGPMQGTYKCPGSALIVPPELLCPDHTFKGFNGTCGDSTSPSDQQQPAEQKCVGPDQLQSTPPVSSRSAPSPQNNIKLAAFTPSDPKSYQNPDIIKVQTTGAKMTSKSTGPITYENEPWKFTYQIVDQEGLVLKDITAGGKLQFKSISVPHFKIDYGLSHEYVRFNAKDDCPSQIVVNEGSYPNYIDTIHWEFTKKFDQEGLKGDLSVRYDIAVRTRYVNNCEKGAGFNCYRFIPQVSFFWSGEPEVLKQLTAFYRFDYGKVGYALTSDYNWFALFVVKNLHRQDILTTDTKFTAVSNGKIGKFDNIHTVHENEQVIIPGCARSAPYHFLGGALKWGTYNAFDCQHIHWRWSSSTFPINVDPMVEPSNEKAISAGRGEPNLVPGQTIQIGIVKVDESSEKDPNEPLWLIDLENPKTIATTYTKNDFDRPILPFERPEKTLKTIVGETILWYVASTKESTTQDKFFRHGIFVIDPPKTKKAELEKIRSNAEGMTIGEKKSALLSQLDTVLQNDKWSPDGMMLSEKNGASVFTGLTNVVASLLEARDKNSSISNDMNEVLAALLTSVQDIVNTDVQTRMFNALSAYSGDKSAVARLFAESEALALSIEKYNAVANITDPSKSKQIMDDLRESWISGIKGVEQVSGNLTAISSSASPRGNDSKPVLDLTGIWSGDDGGTYYIQQLGNIVWWLGMSGNNGESFTNVFKGTIKDNKIDGEWTDVPKGATRNHGTLILNISNDFSNGTQLHKIKETGGFAGSTWTMMEGESMSSNGGTTSKPTQNSQSSGKTGVQENKSTTQNIPGNITQLEGTGQQTKPTSSGMNITDLVAWWPGKTSNNLLVDTTRGGHNGTAHNIWPQSISDLNAPGKVGEAIKMNSGNNSFQQFILVDHNKLFDISPNGALTIDAWMNPNSGGGIIFDKVEAAGNPFANYRFVLGEPGNPNDTRIGFWNGSVYVFSQKSVPLNEFSKVAVTWKDGTAKFYIDGSLDSTHKIPIGPVNTMDEVIGPFKGTIDELKFFNNELSANELSKITNFKSGNQSPSGQQTTTIQEPPTSQLQQQQQQGQQLAKSAKAEMIDYENPDFRLLMKYPSNWALRENPDYVAFTSSAENEADTYMESLYVYHQGDIPLFKSEDETLKKNVDAAIDFRKSFNNFELLSSNNIEFNDNNAGKIEYTYTDPNIGNVKAMEIIAVDGNDKYNILFIANPEQYSSSLPTAQEMIDSIQILSSPPEDEPSTSSQAGDGTGSGEGDDKIDAGSETIVDTFDDTEGTDSGDNGDGIDAGGENTKLLDYECPDYTLKYPSSWHQSDNPICDFSEWDLPTKSGSLFVAIGGDRFFEKETVSWTPKQRLSEYTLKLQKNFEAPTLHRLESDQITVSNRPAEKIIYTEDSKDGTIKHLEVFVQSEKNAWIIHYFEHLDKFESGLTGVQKVLESIKLR